MMVNMCHISPLKACWLSGITIGLISGITIGLISGITIGLISGITIGLIFKKCPFFRLCIYIFCNYLRKKQQLLPFVT